MEFLKQDEQICIRLIIDGIDNRRIKNINVGSIDIELGEPERFSVSRYNNGQLVEIRTENEVKE